MASTTPFSTDDIYCLGTTPPTMRFVNSNPLPRDKGSSSMATRAY